MNDANDWRGRTEFDDMETSLQDKPFASSALAYMVFTVLLFLFVLFVLIPISLCPSVLLRGNDQTCCTTFFPCGSTLRICLHEGPSPNMFARACPEPHGYYH